MIGKIGLIAPYESLIKRAENILNDVDLVILADRAVLQNTLAIAKQMLNAGAEVILIREYSDSYLRGKIDVPIIPIKFSFSEFFNAVLSAARIARKIAITNWQGKFFKINTFKKLLNIEAHEIVWHTRDDLENQISNLPSDIDVVVGGGLTRTVAKKNGKKFILVESSNESIVDAFETAKMILKSIKHETIYKHHLVNVVSNSSEIMISFSEEYEVVAMSRTFKDFFGVNQGATMNLNAQEIAKAIELPNNFFHNLKNKQIIKINKTDCKIYYENIKHNQKSFGKILRIIPSSKRSAPQGNIKIIKSQYQNKFGFSDIIGTSATITEAIKDAKQASLTDFNLLLIGETGTGKEMFAQSVHKFGNRKDSPFFAINCASIPESLLEAELFGYEEGAFTGAIKGGKLGYFELADGGTIFLDEINSMPVSLQPRLLRVIQEKEFMRVGGSENISFDVRIISSSNKDLEALIKDGQFRKDLFYRLTALTIEIPPLRNRLEDIPIIAASICKKLRIDNKAVFHIIQALENIPIYDWPGNVRELENVLIRVSLKNAENKIKNTKMAESAIKSSIRIRNKQNSQVIPENKIISDYNSCELSGVTNSAEQSLINYFLENQKLTRKETAKRLGISRTTLWRKQKKNDVVQ